MIRISFISIIVCLVASCAPIVTSENAGNRESTLDIRLVDVDNTDPMLYAALLDHPHRFTAQELTHVLHSLRYSPRGVIGWDSPRPIFPSDTIAHAAPIFQQALKKVGPLQKVSFTVKTRSGDISGDMFLVDGHLHWRFDELKGTTHFDAYPSPFEFESETAVTPNWIVRPQENQQYGNQETFWGIEQETQNWLQIPIEREIGHTKPTTHERSFIERLAQLRDLAESGLVSDAEYRQKVGQLTEKAEAAAISPHDHLRFLMGLHEAGFISDEELAQKRQDILNRL